MNKDAGYWGLVIAMLGCTLATIAIMLTLTLWMRSEANADRREFHHMMGELRLDVQDAHIRIGVIEKHR